MATPIFPWRDEYSVRISQIDTQHRRLIDLINNLHASMLEGQATQALAKILNDLVRYTESHFRYEEGMLRQRGYSALESHLAEHEILTNQVKQLQEQLRSGKLLITIQVMQFLKDWLANHILTRDMQYSRELVS